MYGQKWSIARADYLISTNEHLMACFGINIADTGFSDDEWLSRFGDLDVEDAIEVYAEKYGLTRVSKESF